MIALYTVIWDINVLIKIKAIKQKKNILLFYKTICYLISVLLNIIEKYNSKIYNYIIIKRKKKIKRKINEILT